MTAVLILGIGAASLVWARLRPRRDPGQAVVFAGTAVIAVSAHRLVTSPAWSAAFWFHATIAVVAVLALLYRRRRLQRA